MPAPSTARSNVNSSRTSTSGGASSRGAQGTKPPVSPESSARAKPSSEASSARSKPTPQPSARTPESGRRAAAPSHRASPENSARSRPPGSARSPESGRPNRASPENSARSPTPESARRGAQGSARKASPEVAWGNTSRRGSAASTSPGRPLGSASSRRASMSSPGRPPIGGPDSALHGASARGQRSARSNNMSARGNPNLPPAARIKRPSIAQAPAPAPRPRQPVPKADVPHTITTERGTTHCPERRIAHAIALLADPDPLARCTGAMELSECGGEWRGRYAEAVTALAANVGSADRALREAAAASLVRVADRGDTHAVRAMMRLLGDPDEAVRMRAAEVLQAVATHGDEEVLGALTECVADANLAVRRGASLATQALLVEAGPQLLVRVAERVCVHLNSKRSEVRWVAARLLGMVGGRGNLVLQRLVMQLLTDEESRVREAALEAVLVLSDGQNGSAISAIQESIVDSVGIGNKRLRRRALRVLEALSGGAEKGALMEFIASSEGSLAYLQGHDDDEWEGGQEREGASQSDDLSLANLWEGWDRIPRNVGCCIGPVDGIVYVQSKCRLWMYNLKDCRVPGNHDEMYWDLWSGFVDWENIRSASVFPDVHDPSFGCVLGPLLRKGEWQLHFLYDLGVLKVPLLTYEDGTSVFEQRTSSLMTLKDALGIEGGGAEPPPWLEPDAATGEWTRDGQRLMMVFKDREVAYFGESPSGKGSVMKHGPYRIQQHVVGGPMTVDAAFGPCEVLEWQGGDWKNRLVVMLVSGDALYEVDVKTLQATKRDRTWVTDDPHDPSNGPSSRPLSRAHAHRAHTPNQVSVSRHDAISSKGSSRRGSVGGGSRPTSSAAHSRPGSSAGQGSRPGTGMGGGSVSGSSGHHGSTRPNSSFIPPKKQPKIETVRKPPSRITLEGFVPACPEVLGDYVILDEVWGRSDRPLYIKVFSEDEPEQQGRLATGASKGSSRGSTTSGALSVSRRTSISPGSVLAPKTSSHTASHTASHAASRTASRRGSLEGSQCMSRTGSPDSEAEDEDCMYMYWVWHGERFMDPDGVGYWVVGEHAGDVNGCLHVKSEGMSPLEVAGTSWFVWSGTTWLVCPDKFVVREGDAPESKELHHKALQNAFEQHSKMQKKRAQRSGGLEAHRVGQRMHAEKTDFTALSQLRDRIVEVTQKGSKVSVSDTLQLYEESVQKTLHELAQQRKQAEDELLAALSVKGVSHEHHVYGWIGKLNAEQTGDSESHFRDRLVLCDEGVLSYISEKEAGKLVKICDLRNVKDTLQVAYDVSGRQFGFRLGFFDGSSISFACKTEADRARWLKEVLRVIKEGND